MAYLFRLCPSFLPKAISFKAPVLCSSFSNASCENKVCDDPTKCDTNDRRGLVLGFFEDPDQNDLKLTKAADDFNCKHDGIIESLIKQNLKLLRPGKGRLFQNVDSKYYGVAIVNLGPEDVGYNPLETLDECRENARIAAAVGTRYLMDHQVCYIMVDPMENAEAAAEGAILTSYRYHGHKYFENHDRPVNIEMLGDPDNNWEIGKLKGQSQNIARRLSDMPPNELTPLKFGEIALDCLCGCDVQVDLREKRWLMTNRLNATLHIAKGSVQPPFYLELCYGGAEQHEQPVILIGKGVTFNCGGLHLKPCKGMSEFKADMSAAGVIIATMRAIAMMQLPINVIGMIPLCENMMSGMCVKPGDVLTSYSGKTILVENTDNEGRVMMADLIDYALPLHCPKLVVSLSTMTYGILAALGAGATGCYSNNHELFTMMQESGAYTGDRVWRFPLWKHFTKKMIDITAADITNLGRSIGGGSEKGAAFLHQFIRCVDWVHLDTSSCGLLATHNDFPYLTHGNMTGRPTRTLIDFMYRYACPCAKPGPEIPQEQVCQPEERNEKNRCT